VNTQAGEPRWVTVFISQTGRCEDCDLRHALDPVGLPLYSKHYGYKLTHGCAGCSGTGRAGQHIGVDVTELLGCLTEKQRFVIERRYGFVGRRYTLEEIAYVMGTSKQAVHKHEQLAKKKLFSTFMVDR
jgi:hypothetical protein